MELTVIVSYYKALDNLKLILKALNKQSNRNFEIILSEDDYNEQTIEFVLQHKDAFDFPIVHLYQKVDNGFRKNEMLNRSIVKAKADKLAFIDGDCIPHRHFVDEYIKTMQEGYFYSGRSVLLGKNITEKVKAEQSIRSLNFFSILFTKSRMKKEGIYSPLIPLTLKKKARGLVGRNWGIHKKALIDVNGFDADFVHAGVGEDNDIEWRISGNGLKIKSIKNKAIVYHLYHAKGYSEKMVSYNFELLYKKIKENRVICLNGIKTLGSDVPHTLVNV